MSKRISLCLVVLLLTVAPSLYALKASDGKKPFEPTTGATEPPPPATGDSIGTLFSQIAAAIRVAIAVRGY